MSAWRNRNDQLGNYDDIARHVGIVENIAS
jgi:hypothetical protein